ncbi:hypothetical protein [Rugosimonospora acidiphila]
MTVTPLSATLLWLVTVIVPETDHVLGDAAFPVDDTVMPAGAVA